MLKSLCWIAAGGAVGAVARFGVVSVSGKLGFHFPWGTLAVNLVGSLTIGIALGAFEHHDWFQDIGRPFLVVGVLGAFTTFSAFSMETVVLLDDHRFAMALTYVAASVIACLIAAWGGYRIGQVA